MSFESYLKESVKEINHEINDFFPRKLSKKWLEGVFGRPEFGFDLETLDKSIVEPVWDFLDRGGKRWRPALMILCCEAVGGKKKNAMPFVAIPELLHAGTLVIDDVEDNSDMRRGKPSMHKLFGLDIAVNNGTLLYYLPMSILFSDNKISAVTKSRLYDVYCQEMLKLSFGQGMDIFWHKGKKDVVSKEHYLQMCSYKTGTLARLSARFGAILGGADAKLEVLLGDFANTIGVAFQIHDDVLNLSKENVLGKDFAEDIMEGKRTLMVIHCIENSSTKDGLRLKEILSMHTDDVGLKREAIELMEKSGSLDYASGVAREIILGAWSAVEPKLKQSKSKALLKDFANYLVERKN